jgi:hypothetical protein
MSIVTPIDIMGLERELHIAHHNRLAHKKYKNITLIHQKNSLLSDREHHLHKTS